MKQEPGEKVLVIGAGYAGLTAAITMASYGYQVTVVEKHETTGGRGRAFSESGFTFDMGPSWYWMPEVAEGFFNRHGRRIGDYLSLVRLDPSYQVVFGKNDAVQLPASFSGICSLFESIEKGAGSKLKIFMREAEYKYQTAMKTYINKPGLHISELCNVEVLQSVLRMDMLQSFRSHASKFFKDERLLRIIEFPILFLGATADKIPAMYSMMNYADMKLGTWYPMGGMVKLSEALTTLAREKGVHFLNGTEVTSLVVINDKVSGVATNRGVISADIVISGADYHHTDRELLPVQKSNYSEEYWQKRVMAPSCLIYYIGVTRKLPGLLHHNLFFEHDLQQHAAAIYKTSTWPSHPLFYLCCPSKTDISVAPEGMENLFYLIPTAPGLADTPEIRERYLKMLLSETELFCGERFEKDIIYSRSYAYSNFIEDYHAFKGNAYGLANTLGQTSFLKPSIRHKKIKNLFFTGQLTVPGPGVPPAILSGEMVAHHILKQKSVKHEIFI
ncbi:NAD(P)/FAD-dependent oxidoreductase [[Flexibacter] sp. ATCC 35208]|uniref:phytoene desaturase family protein n=1 Tax=[Flexibacter] sp. ATCC 35208 TaxID=1936242 RepID=UPI0009D07758|nr:phytoene desaturase family protein [[Flexibacter] sp. ATCC 35208]OMP77037.1 phytoene dehydrogenase [[Flexibacter] sp. ATCC 35208]